MEVTVLAPLNTTRPAALLTVMAPFRVTAAALATTFRSNAPETVPVTDSTAVEEPE